MPSVWSEEVVNQLKAYAAQGLSAAQAAAKFEGMTRNAAVGLAHRKKFQFRGTRWSSGSKRKAAKENQGPMRPKTDVIQKPKVAPTVMIAIEVAPPPADGVTLDGLESWMCKFITGDPLTPEFRYCGGRQAGGKPYCHFHCRMTYETMEQRIAVARSRRA